MSNTIPNCSLFGATVSIDLTEIYIDGERFYNPILTYFLYQPHSEEEQKSISIITNVYDACKYKVTKAIFESMSIMFKGIDPVVFVFDHEFNIIEDLNINDILTDCEDNEK